MNKNIITAIDIDLNRTTIEKQIEDSLLIFNKKRLKHELKDVRERLKLEFPNNPEKHIPKKELSESIMARLSADDESKAYKEHIRETISGEKENYYVLRDYIDGLNDINEFSAEIERCGLQKVDNFDMYEPLVRLSVKNIRLFEQSVKIRMQHIRLYIDSLKTKKIKNAERTNSELSLVVTLRELYKIDKKYDDIDLYNNYDMLSNIDYSNILADRLLKKCLDADNSNIINTFSSNNTPLTKGVDTSIISNMMLGVLCMNNKNTSFITNNSITCLKNMYVNNTTNDRVYNTRTLGELFYDITNDELKNIDKADRQQIYMTYEGSRPSSEEYHKWSGLQVYDIDLKYWEGNVELLKQQMFNKLSKYHWFLWICRSTSGKGIHIYTKVTPPHHVHTNIEENEFLSKYLYQVNYLTKLSVVYNILFELNKDVMSGIDFTKDYFNAESNFFEMSNKIFVDGEKKEVGVDNSVGRITSGIRLTYDPRPLVNHSFVDLHVSMNLGQSLNGYDDPHYLKTVILRETPLVLKHIVNINEFANKKHENFYEDESTKAIDISKYITTGNDLDLLTPMPRSAINYQLRYNVCNTLAALFGKEGLSLAHIILDSKGCKNVGEINAFYSCAITNKKQATKFGLEILKRNGVVKSIEPEYKEVIDNNFKNSIKIAIEKVLDNDALTNTIELNQNEYLSDIKGVLTNPKKGGLTNDKINIIFSPPGTGKCLGINTPILMYDGSIKMVQDIVVGDVIMGWDSTPRNVLALGGGREELFKVIPNNGDTWVCNKSHILSLIETGVVPTLETIDNIAVSDYLQTESNKGLFRMLPTGVEYVPFVLESQGIGDYYGFEIDGDKMFLLGDCTVTHNTEYIKTLAKDKKRILLVLPYISVIENKIAKDESIMTMFECFYGSKDIKDIERGINAVTTFDKFSRANYEKISRMFDYIFIDESHLLFTSSYRIEATSNTIKKIKDLFYISQNDPFAAKLCLLTGTETGESYFFGNVANIIRIHKKSLDKTMEFVICDDVLDATTRLATKASTLIQTGHKLLIPTNKGEIYSEKIIGMLEHLLGRQLKYGYYKRSNTEQEICRLINDSNTVGDYDIVFCSNYLSVGVDINDKCKFASIYLGNFSAYEIEQFNARIRKTSITSIYCIQTEKSDGTINELLLDEPDLVLKITEEDKENFLDDKQISGAKQEFLAQYDPVLHKISTPGFSYLNGKIRFNIEEYELTTFENKYNDCMQHPVKVARELAKYGYDISVCTEFDGLELTQQNELKSVGIAAAKQEKIRKHNMLVGTFIELVQKNKFTNKHGLEYNDVIHWLLKNNDNIVENREQEEHIKIKFDAFASPVSAVVKSKEAMDAMIQSAKYLISKYTPEKAISIITQYVDDAGVLKQKSFKRSINLLKLVESSDANELASPITNILEKMYDFVDIFEANKETKISYNTYKAKVDEWTNGYIDNLRIRINTKFAFDKIQDSLLELLYDIANKSTSKAGIRFEYNKLPDTNSSNVLNRRSVDNIIEKLFKISNDSNKGNKRSPRKKNIIIESQIPF